MDKQIKYPPKRVSLNLNNLIFGDYPLRIVIAVHPGDLAKGYVDTAVELIDEVLEHKKGQQ